ncbi:CAL1 [Auxenochlorella protothecoides x Auxenochlorella symbiontica]
MSNAEQWFRIIDKDRSGSLDVFELQNALALGKINFSLKTVQSVMRLYDADGNGKMGLPEYHRLHSFLSNVTLAFRRYDTDNSGNLDQAEVKIALRDAGFNLDDPAFIALFKSFDPDKSNSLCLTEFMGMTIFLQSISAAFSAFDPRRTGQVSLNFNQAVYFVSNCT